MSRLEFGPKPKEMEVTDIATGHLVFSPVKGEDVSYASLNKAVTDAGYEIEGAVIAVSGTLNDDRHLVTPGGQTFHLTAVDEKLKVRLLEQLEPGVRVKLEGVWKIEEGAEIIVVSKISSPEGEGTSGESAR